MMCARTRPTLPYFLLLLLLLLLLLRIAVGVSLELVITLSGHFGVKPVRDSWPDFGCSQDSYGFGYHGMGRPVSRENGSVT